MKPRVTLFLVGLSLFLVALPGRAQKDPVKADTARFGNPTSTARNYQNYIYGVIKQIDSDGMVLEKTKYGIDQPFLFDRKTKFIEDEKASTKDKLKVGDKIWVEVQKNKKTGDLIAKKVVTGAEVVAIP